MRGGLRIGIVGGSLGGLFAGVLLHRAGFDVAVFERSTSGLEGRVPGWLGRAKSLRSCARSAASMWLKWALSRGSASRSTAMATSSNAKPPPRCRFPWDRMFGAFRERLPDDRYHLGKALVATGTTTAKSIALQFEDGQEDVFDLVIGADGVGSQVRSRVVDSDCQPIYAGYAAWRGLLPETDLPPIAAAQLLDRFAFHYPPRSQILGYLVPGPDGAIEPGRRRYNWVWYRVVSASTGALAAALSDRNGVTHVYSLAPGEMRDEARAALAGEACDALPPSFAAAVRAEPRPFVQAIFDYSSPIMMRERIALLGDAAFVVRPHTAMGVAKAAGDAITLRDALLAAPDLSSALALYDADRRPVGAAIAAYGRRLGASLS